MDSLQAADLNRLINDINTPDTGDQSGWNASGPAVKNDPEDVSEHSELKKAGWTMLNEYPFVSCVVEICIGVIMEVSILLSILGGPGWRVS